MSTFSSYFTLAVLIREVYYFCISSRRWEIFAGDVDNNNTLPGLENNFMGGVSRAY